MKLRNSRTKESRKKSKKYRSIRAFRRRQRRPRPLHLGKVNWESVAKIFEQSSKEILREKKSNLYPALEEILPFLAVGALLPLALVFPKGVATIMPSLFPIDRYQRKRLTQQIKRLKQQKLVEVTQENGIDVVKITEQGKVRALKYKLSELRITKPRRWDNKWRMVIFDVPTKFDDMRDVFRSHLKRLGFYQFQESVYVHPYPCFDMIEFLRHLLGVEIAVKYVLAESIEDDSELKMKFGLA